MVEERLAFYHEIIQSNFKVGKEKESIAGKKQSVNDEGNYILITQSKMKFRFPAEGLLLT